MYYTLSLLFSVLQLRVFCNRDNIQLLYTAFGKMPEGKALILTGIDNLVFTETEIESFVWNSIGIQFKAG